MSMQPVACLRPTSISRRCRPWASTRLRRIPVVDEEGRLAGIIAQADVATRLAQPSTTGAMVEAISEPGMSAR